MSTITAHEIEDYAPGRIIEAHWGYDQTNVDFYRIVKRSGDWLTIEPIPSIEADYNAERMTGHVVPDECRPATGKTFRRKIHHYAGHPRGIMVNSFTSADLWDGRPGSFSDYA